ncbi:hypothetical protein ERJ75_000383000 [Trypanosoma vivax]|uniref:Transmembrane protein n=1 Tax=Trypanosoma vivax (strain Y486) TaxID=1055687 RepID=G0TRY9_TRYVY|nr:hypothetical protein TRVL_03052 [Trypanosoma vivax]KAH8617363.1 hypothetical protein ERJ75_000383000 [Trypanosoma vivax]CCC46713.1 conserved hypothetical protein [Trypanosoma vivax Y486]
MQGGVEGDDDGASPQSRAAASEDVADQTGATCVETASSPSPTPGVRTYSTPPPPPQGAGVATEAYVHQRWSSLRAACFATPTVGSSTDSHSFASDLNLTFPPRVSSRRRCYMSRASKAAYVFTMNAQEESHQSPPLESIKTRRGSAAGSMGKAVYGDELNASPPSSFAPAASTTVSTLTSKWEGNDNLALAAAGEGVQAANSIQEAEPLDLALTRSQFAAFRFSETQHALPKSILSTSFAGRDVSRACGTQIQAHSTTDVDGISESLPIFNDSSRRAITSGTDFAVIQASDSVHATEGERRRTKCPISYRVIKVRSSNKDAENNNDNDDDDSTTVHSDDCYFSDGCSYLPLRMWAFAKRCLCPSYSGERREESEREREGRARVFFNSVNMQRPVDQSAFHHCLETGSVCARKLLKLWRFINVFTGDLPRTSCIFCLLNYLAFVLAVIASMVLFVATYNGRLSSVASVPLCEDVGVLTVVPTEVTLSLASIILNSLFASRFALRAVRFENTGSLLCHLFVVLVQASCAIYYILSANQETATYRVQVWSKSMFGISTLLLLSSCFMYDLVSRTFGWRIFMKGITFSNILRRHKLHMYVQSCAQLDLVSTTNITIVGPFLALGEGEKWVSLISSLLSIVLAYALTPLCKKQAQWFLAVFAVATAASAGFNSYLIGCAFSKYILSSAHLGNAKSWILLETLEHYQEERGTNHIDQVALPNHCINGRAWGMNSSGGSVSGYRTIYTMLSANMWETHYYRESTHMHPSLLPGACKAAGGTVPCCQGRILNRPLDGLRCFDVGFLLFLMCFVVIVRIVVVKLWLLTGVKDGGRSVAPCPVRAGQGTVEACGSDEGGV